MTETVDRAPRISRRPVLKGLVGFAAASVISGGFPVEVLGRAGTGSFNYENRLLCEENLQCPSFFIPERPDFTLHTPDFLLVTPKIWQEIAQ